MLVVGDHISMTTADSPRSHVPLLHETAMSHNAVDVRHSALQRFHARRFQAKLSCSRKHSSITELFFYFFFNAGVLAFGANFLNFSQKSAVNNGTVVSLEKISCGGFWLIN